MGHHCVPGGAVVGHRTGGYRDGVKCFDCAVSTALVFRADDGWIDQIWSERLAVAATVSSMDSPNMSQARPR